MIALDTGHVGFRVELVDEAPVLDGFWEDAVEVSFTPTTDHVSLAQFAAEATFPLALPVQDYRVRYCARRMDAASETDNIPPDAPHIDSYCLVFWPAAPAPDRIVRKTSRYASYWHAERAKGNW